MMISVIKRAVVNPVILAPKKIISKGRTQHIVPAFFILGDCYEPNIPPQKLRFLNKFGKDVTC
jgi:hypothetical protein